MYMQLDRTSARPLYQQVVAEIQRRIRSGALPTGARLPTVRELAGQLGVTRLTVHNAYSELQAGGWVEATVGRGTFVASQAGEHAREADLGREISPAGAISDMVRLAQLPGIRSLAMADAAPDLYPKREFARALEEALAYDSAAVLGYTSAQGEPLLRTVLADLLRGRGVQAGPDALIVTNGVTQGLSLVSRALAAPGDTVFIEQPTYVGAINIFNRQNLRLVSVPIDEHGIDTDALADLLTQHRPRFLYTIPVHHNPTGVTMSPERRAALLELARQHNLLIIEDDIYAPIGLDAPAPPSLMADDTSDLVLHLGSFSKAALPGVRLGYIAAPQKLVATLAHHKQTDDLCSPPLLQRAMAVFIKNGSYAAHLRRALPHYRARRDALAEAMALTMPSAARWSIPGGGFSIWVRLPDGTSVADLYLAAIDRGVAFTPGDLFFSGTAPGSYIRVCYSALPPEQLREAALILGGLLADHLHQRTYIPPQPSVYLPLV